ncbi:hypothetical protein KY285_007841 [Solanum tuberosum]|nr:hypothetical protein KY285_007839 [Solanum tuberosum]KAH0746184.1 hypothetical protein KY285_007841 [Solanum tuberosum]
MNFSQDISYGAGWSLRETSAHFQGQTIPGVDFRRHFCQKISWTSIKTLDMEPTGPDGQTGQFSRSNDPRRG